MQREYPQFLPRMRIDESAGAVLRPLDPAGGSMAGPATARA
jgi:hypothetical protein